MPPRQSTPQPPGNSRRRPGPAVPTGWVWLVLLAMVLMALWFAGGDTAGLVPVDYSDFWKLVSEQKLSRVTFVGTDKIIGEIKDPNNLPKTIQNPEEFRKKLHNGKFSVNKI